METAKTFHDKNRWRGLHPSISTYGRSEENNGEKGSENEGLMLKKSSILPILGVALIGLFVVSDRSYGFKQEDLDKLAATGQCLFCDLA